MALENKTNFAVPLQCQYSAISGDFYLEMCYAVGVIDNELRKRIGDIGIQKNYRRTEKAMISISSILNKHGVGTLYFGEKPNGDVIGQDVSESSLRDVSRFVCESIKPHIYPVIQEEILDDRHVIKVEFHGEDYPYFVAGRYYLRTTDEDREVTPAELRQFFVANEYMFFVKHFSLKKASEFPVFIRGFSLLLAGNIYASLRMSACSMR